jgi:uncharacterized membrane protein YraQ (UPF0718 family)
VIALLAVTSVAFVQPDERSMKKTLLAATAAVLLIAGQAAAAGTSVVRVGDRVGAAGEESSEFAGVPIAVLVAGAAIIVAAVVVISEEDDSESD